MHYLLEVVLWSSIKQMGSMVKTETPQQAYHSVGEIFFGVAFLNSCTSVIPNPNLQINKVLSNSNKTGGTKQKSRRQGLWTTREKIVVNARPKIQSQSQIFRYGQSIFCLLRWHNFLDIFDLCLHWLSVVRGR